MFRTFNLGGGNNRWFGNDYAYGEDDVFVINLGGGADNAITGGGRKFFLNTGNDLSPDNAYNESIKPGDRWVGGHVIYTIDGQRYEEGEHLYHGGAGDSFRITLPEYRGADIWATTTRMADIITQGTVQYHGSAGTLWFKAWDTRNMPDGTGAQQLHLAAERFSDLEFYKLVYEQVSEDVIRLDVVTIHGNHALRHLDDAQIKADFRMLHENARVYLDVDGTDGVTYAEAREAVYDWGREQVQDGTIGLGA